MPSDICFFQDLLKKIFIKKTPDHAPLSKHTPNGSVFKKAKNQLFLDIQLNYAKDVPYKGKRDRY